MKIATLNFQISLVHLLITLKVFIAFIIWTWIQLNIKMQFKGHMTNFIKHIVSVFYGS